MKFRAQARGSAAVRIQKELSALASRVAALEQEVNGPPAEELLEQFSATKNALDARAAAIEEYNRLQREEFYKALPLAREMAEKHKAKYEAFMRERGFEP